MDSCYTCYCVMAIILNNLFHGSVKQHSFYSSFTVDFEKPPIITDGHGHFLIGFNDDDDKKKVTKYIKILKKVTLQPGLKKLKIF